MGCICSYPKLWRQNNLQTQQEASAQSTCEHTSYRRGEKIYENTHKAELFAKTMEKQFTNNQGADLEEVSGTINSLNNSDTKSGSFISPNEIMEMIKNCPNNKAPGHDGITNKALKHLPQKAVIQISKIFTVCLRLCYFPDSWKKSQPTRKSQTNLTSLHNFKSI